jgi:hypothetical protein
VKPTDLLYTAQHMVAEARARARDEAVGIELLRRLREHHSQNENQPPWQAEAGSNIRRGSYKDNDDFNFPRASAQG